MNKIDLLDPSGTNPMTNQPYNEKYRILSNFPAFKKADIILKAMEKHQLIILESATGSGKSVIVPKLALHFTDYQGTVVMTLPKKLAALSSATFSSQISDLTLGKEIGYVFKGSPREMIGPENKIIYMTDGYFVVEYLKDPLLSKFNVVIIDEAHERTIRIDLIMLFLKTLLESGKRPDIKVVIMSATFDVNKYKKYFGKVDSAILSISGVTKHDISIQYLKEPSKNYLNTGIDVIDMIVKSGKKDGILFFVTTSSEALQICRKVRSSYPNIFCVEVYSEMDQKLKLYAEDRDKFKELGNYDQKVIIATNVAESSITIDGISFVIDSCYELYNYYDPTIYGQVLEKRLITNAQAAQRRGRVGRTGPGTCYHLMTKNQFAKLAPYPVPEILRQDVTMSLLQVINLTDNKNYADGYLLLSKLMDVPDKKYIDAAYQLYKMYNLLDSHDKMTEYAHYVLKFNALPINQILFMIYAFQQYCSHQATIIVAMMERLGGKLINLFYASSFMKCKNNRKLDESIVKKFVVKSSDHLTFLKIFTDFDQSEDKREWCRKHNAKYDLLNSISNLAKNYYTQLLTMLKTKNEPSRVGDDVDVTDKILDSLKNSHKHLRANKLVPVITSTSNKGNISANSVTNYFKKVSQKNIIYNDITNINGKWEFNVITIV